MNRPDLLSSLLLLLPAPVLLSGCATESKHVVGLRQVDGFVGRVERVHVDAELARDRMLNTMDALEAIIASDFGADPMLAYTTFIDAVTASEQQADSFGSSLKSMKGAAGSVFEDWGRSLDAISSIEMRQLSLTRLTRTRDRYTAIADAMDPAYASLTEFNQTMRDLAFFLGHDFNAASVRQINHQYTLLASRSESLQQGLELGLSAVIEYLDASALPGAVEVTPAGPQLQPEEEPPAGPRTRPDADGYNR